MSGFTATAQQKFTVTGKVTGVADGQIVGLYHSEGGVLVPAGMDTIRNGQFSLAGTTESTAPFVLRGATDNFPYMYLDIWGAPGAKITVKGEGYLIKTWEVTNNVPEQKEANRYLKANMATWQQIQRNSIAQRQLSKQIRAASPEVRQTLKTAVDSLNTDYNNLLGRIHEGEITLMRQLPVTTIWLDKLTSLANHVKHNPQAPYRHDVVQLYKNLTPAQQQSIAGKTVAGYLFPPVVVQRGEKMADTSLPDLSGKQHRLADYQGQYVLLDFWSFACGPCMMAMPELKAVSNSLNGRLTVVSINIDSKKSVWEAASKRENITWVNLNDQLGMAGLAAKYGVRGIPHYVMIAPDGTVADYWIGYEKGKFSEKVHSILK